MILFSHGFGVQKDSRGMFTDIKQALDGACHLFDYNTWNDDTQELTVATLDDQVRKLRAERDALSDVDTLICHSQGCLVAALAQLEGIPKTIFLAPATTTNSDKFAKLFTNRPESVYNRDGDSKLQRRDGSTTIVPKEYWDSLDGVGDVRVRYQHTANNTDLHIVTAEADEVLGKADFSQLDNVTLHSIAGANHNFDDPARAALLAKVQEIVG